MDHTLSAMMSRKSVSLASGLVYFFMTHPPSGVNILRHSVDAGNWLVGREGISHHVLGSGERDIHIPEGFYRSTAEPS
ncbi:hypothetical protein ACFC1D_21095 [Streptomyces vinaceus]|uniref:hypothetical protein n=1 Tax=Streptomyces vinaceus TaxID=1960 RepID=UPI0035D86783